MIYRDIYLSNFIFEKVGVAITEREQSIGLMNLDPPAKPMAFYYSYPSVLKFWMLNTKFPLDIIFCRSGQITQICQGCPFSQEMIGDNSFSDLVVELPKGTAEKFGLAVGQKAGILKVEEKSGQD